MLQSNHDDYHKEHTTGQHFQAKHRTRLKSKCPKSSKLFAKIRAKRGEVFWKTLPKPRIFQNLLENVFEGAEKLFCAKRGEQIFIFSREARRKFFAFSCEARRKFFTFSRKARKTIFLQKLETDTALKKCRFFITFLTSASTFSASGKIFEKAGDQT